jgi:hypothetical protein
MKKLRVPSGLQQSNNQNAADNSLSLILWRLRVHYRVSLNPLLNHILSNIDPGYSFTFCLIIIIWLYSPSRALASPLGLRNNKLLTGLDC